MQQVLEAVLPHVTDACTLVRCSLLSQQCQVLVRDAVRLNLATLVQQCAGCRNSNSNTKAKQLQWLCNTAGPTAVNTFEAGCAILQLLDDWCTDGGTRVLELDKTGLRLTNALFTQLAKKSWSRLLSENSHAHSAFESVDTVYKSVAWTDAGAPHLFHHFEAKLPRVTEVDMPDLLRIACMRSVGCLEQLLQHDRDCTHVLHSPDTDASTAAALRPSHQQHQQHQEQAMLLLTELMTQAVTNNGPQALWQLCQVPLAQRLDALQVTRLLFHAASNPEADGNDISETASHPCVIGCLVSLRGAQALSAGCIATLLSHGEHNDSWRHLVPLLQLPHARQISSKRLCQLILAVSRAKMPNVRARLFRLAQGRRLESRHVVELIKVFMTEPDLLDSEDHDPYFGNLVWKLNDLQPGFHLGPEGVLDLLQHCNEDMHNDWSDVCFEPGASEITCTPRFVEVVKGMAVAPVEYDVIGRILENGGLPALKQLQTADWYDVFVFVLERGHLIPEGVDALPAVQSISTDSITQLLQLACKKGCTEGMQRLMSLPAAQQLQAPAIGDLLLQLLRPMGSSWGLDNEAWEGLLSLPEAQHIAVAAVQQVFDAALEQGLALAAGSIFALPQTEGLQCSLTGGELVHSIHTAWERSGESAADDILVLVALAVHLESFSASDVGVLLRELMSEREGEGDCHDWRGERSRHEGQLSLVSQVLPHLQSLSAFQELVVEDVVALLTLSLDRYQGALVPTFAAIPAAARITAYQLLLLLGGGCPNWGVELLQLPAAQQLKPAQIVGLLEQRLRHIDSRDAREIERASDVVRVLLNQPAASQLACADIALLARCAILHTRSFQAVQLLLQHPAGQKLDASALVELLRLAAEWFALTFMLLQQPAAAAINADAVCELLESALECNNPGRIVSRLLQLPGARQLSINQVKGLMWQALQYGDAACWKELSVLPVVATSDDPELHIMVEVAPSTWGFTLGV